MRSPEWFSRGGEADSIDRAVDAFEARMESGGPPLARFWNELESKKTPAVLAALVKVDLRRRFERGERPRVLEYLGAFPDLADDGDRVVSLVYEEFCLLEENGYDPDSGVFCEDYGPWRDSLASQLAYHRELSRAVGAESPSVNFPDPGDRFGKYRLDSILGVGGVARVYLATEDELGGRQLAIKVSASFGQEPSILAKLDHRNIVPILTVAESESGLRGICMPYRPGQTMEELIRRIGRVTPPREARAISDALRPRDASVGFPPDEQRVGWADFPIDRTFPEAIAWIGLALAQALSYLHKQGIYHRDIKPANILLADREGPQLLDFNLAQDPSNPEGATAAQKGGTLPYMAPEQLKAFLDPAAWGEVEETADLYSLGLVLRELLTGRVPELPKGQGSLAREIQDLIDRRKIPQESIREINPGVPPALDSIIGKCLAFHPAHRYDGANDLATDLRRFIERKPLLHAPNPSKIELGVNWAYRNRHGIVATFLFSAILFSLLGFFRADDHGRAELLAAKACLDSGRLLEAKAAYEKVYPEHPKTAWSSLGLAVTLFKLNELDHDPSRDAKRISKLLGEARAESDSIDAFREFLAKYPNSATLHLNLGIVLTEKGRLADARESLERSLEIDPNGIAAIVALANLDQKAGDEEQAIRGLTRAIEWYLEKNVGREQVHDLRQWVLFNFVNLIDKKLDGWLASESRIESDSYLQQLEATLNLFKGKDWERIRDSSDEKAHSFWVNYYEGCLLSIRGVLQSEVDDSVRSDGFFDAAAERFQAAKSMVFRLDAPKDRLDKVRLQVEKLDKRRSLRVSLR